MSDIVDNAVAYTPAGGSVDCTLRREGGEAVLEVVGTGPGVEPAQLPRLLDRFFRAAPIDKMGSGLGLAIVKAFVDRHGMGIAIDDRVARSGLAGRVRMPAAGLEGSSRRGRSGPTRCSGERGGEPRLRCLLKAWIGQCGMPSRGRRRSSLGP